MPSKQNNRAVKFSLLALLLCALCVSSPLLSALHSSPPARPKILGIASVHFYSSEVPQARELYRVILSDTAACDWCEKLPTSNSFYFPSGQSILLTAPPASTPSSSKLKGIAFQIDDFRAMTAFLKSKKIDFQMELPVDGDGYLTLIDPEGHEINFVEFGHSYSSLTIAPEMKGAAAVPVRIIHAGFVVKDRAAMDKFYKDVLGFHLYWSGGMKDGETNWVDMQVPDGTDWLEYMLNVPPNATDKTLGVMNHIALGVPDIHAAQQQLIKNGWKGTEQPKIGRDGKWQLNLYDPDDTRVELMEFTPVEKPCCSEYTGPHPKP